MNPRFNSLLIPFVAVDTDNVMAVGVFVVVWTVPPICDAGVVEVRIGLMLGNVALNTAPERVGTGGDGGLVRIESASLAGRAAGTSAIAGGAE